MADATTTRPAHLWTSETRPAAHRPKGVPNKVTADMKAMILGALERAGGVDYLVERALDPDTMGGFLALLGKIIPRDIRADVSVTSRVQLIQAAMLIPQELVDATLVALRAGPMAKEIEAEVKP